MWVVMSKIPPEPTSDRWPLVRVHWLDSAAPRGWQPMADWPETHSLECVSVGFLYAEDKYAKTIVPHFAFPDDDVNRQGGGVMVIPAGAIVSMVRLVSDGESDRATEPSISRSLSVQALGRSGSAGARSSRRS
jgi:hypothetical protein